MPVRRLYFLRHGPASPREGWSGDDAKRPLTETGRTRTKCLAEMIAGSEVVCDLVLTSPLVRAKQTAEIAAKALDCPLQVDDTLSPGFDLAALAAMLERVGDHTSVMIVGHEPSFSEVLSEVIGGGRIVLKKAACARIDLDEPGKPSGELLWLLTPSSVGC